MFKYAPYVASFDGLYEGHFMKKLKRNLSLLLMSTIFLTACGDKPSESTTSPKTQSTKPSPNTAPQESTTNQMVNEASNETKADEVQTTQSATSDETNKGSTETNQPANADKANTESTPVQALSLAEGKARYEKTCKICHEQGLLDAPKLTAKADWAKRLAEKDMNTLYKHSAKGFNKMPAQAVADISEAEVYAAVDYMVSQVK